jgi:hypothetical protein
VPIIPDSNTSAAHKRTALTKPARLAIALFTAMHISDCVDLPEEYHVL